MNPENPQSSRTLQIALLASLLMMGAGIGLLLWNDVRQKNLEVALGQKIVGEFQANNEPKIRELIVNLQNFSKTNPDFAPVLAKYNLLPSQNAASTQPKK